MKLYVHGPDCQQGHEPHAQIKIFPEIPAHQCFICDEEQSVLVVYSGQSFRLMRITRQETQFYTLLFEWYPAYAPDAALTGVLTSKESHPERLGRIVTSLRTKMMPLGISRVAKAGYLLVYLPDQDLSAR